MFVLDEADEFFLDSKREEEIKEFHKKLQAVNKTCQYILFSATYDTLVSEKIAEIVSDANQVSL